MACASSGVEQTDRGTSSPEFASFAAEIRQEFKPEGPLERLLVESIIQAAWRLEIAIERHGSGAIERRPDAKPGRSNLRSTAIEHASRTVRETLEALNAHRKLRTGSALLVAARTQIEPEISPNEWPIVPSKTGIGEGLGDDEEPTHYRDRLTFDFEVSDVSPVVKGTWVTVGHVVSLIVDGWTWADILRSHPELSEDDIRACVTYAMEEENETAL